MWPDWIEELKQRYLAEAGSVFLLHGPGVGVARWPYEDELLDAGRLVARFLTQSRDIVVLYDPKVGRLGWGGIEDLGRFKRHTEAALTLNQQSRPDHRVPENALGLFWLAMHTPGANQAVVLYHAEQLAPRRRSVPEPLALDAPPLEDWNRDAALRESDNVVILLTTELAEVRDEVLDNCVQIELPAPPKPKPVMAPDELSLQRTAPADAEAEVDAALNAASDPGAEDQPEPLAMARAEAEVDSSEESVPPATESEPEGPPKPPAEAANIGLLVEQALEAAVIRHADGPPWTDHHPAKEAVAEVMHALAPHRVGVLRFTEADGQLLAEGKGAEWFDGWWATDIAVEAACGMALNGLEKPVGGFSEEQPPRFAEPALRALARRIEKALG